MNKNSVSPYGRNNSFLAEAYVKFFPVCLHPNFPQTNKALRRLIQHMTSKPETLLNNNSLLCNTCKLAFYHLIASKCENFFCASHSLFTENISCLIIN